MHLRNLKSVASYQKRPRGPDHTLLEGNFLPLGMMGLAVVDPLAKFKQHSLIHSRNIEIYKNLKKGYVTQTTPLSSGNFYSCGGTCCS